MNDVASDKGLGSGQMISPSYAKYSLFILMLVFLVHNLDRQIMSILLVPIQNDLQVSDTAMGILTGFAFAVVYVCGGIPMAYLCDRGNRRNILSVVIAIWSGCTALCGLATSYVQLLFARIGVAAGEAGGNPACVSIISDLFPAAKRGTAMGFFYVGAAMGIFAGMWLGGWINDAMGWRMAFIVVGLPGILLALVVRFTLKEPSRGSSDGIEIKAGDKPSFLHVQKYLWGLRTYRFLIAGNAFQSVAIYAVFAWTPAFFIRIHELSTAEVGFWVGILSGFGAASGNLLGGFLSDRLGKRSSGWYMGVSGLAMLIAIPFVLMYVYFDLPAFALAAYFPMIGLLGACAPCVAAVTQGVVKPTMRAMSYSTQYMITALVGMGGGPFIVGVLNDYLQQDYGDHAVRYSLFAVASVASIISAIAFVLAVRTVGSDMQKAKE